MDADDCLRLAVTLAGALAHLHECGLIHRDVKPSNVLYTGGVPKLGDIGLVAEAGGSRSFVGTEGFVPAEGPGTERADLFALGKTLYEALTGLDRTRYPELPADWPQRYDFPQRLELNEIVLRACEADAHRRSHSAREMLADAAVLASGRSVKSLRRLERRVRMARRGMVALTAAALAAAGAFVWAQRENVLTRERAERAASEASAASARREARTARYYSLFDRVRAARRDVNAGAVTLALAAAREAAAGDPPGGESRTALRTEAAFLLGRPDLTPLETPAIGPADAQRTVMLDPAQRRFLHLPWPLLSPPENRPSAARGGTVPLEGGAPLELPPEFTASHSWALQFSPDGGSLLDPDMAAARPAQVWPLRPGAAPITLSGPPAVDARWLPGGGIVQSCAPGDLVFCTAQGKEERRVTLQGWTAGHIFPSPDGSQIALPDKGDTIRFYNVRTGAERVWSLPSTDLTVQDVQWSTGGIWMAAVCSHPGTKEQSIYTLRQGISGPALASRQRGGGVSAVFMEEPHLLATSGWGGVTWVEDLIHSVPVVKVNYAAGTAPRFGGGILGLHLWNHEAMNLLTWHPSPVLQVLHCAPEVPQWLTFSPDGRWLAAGGDYGMQWWSLDPVATAAPFRTDAGPDLRLVHFPPGGRTARCLGAAGVTDYDFNPAATEASALLTHPRPVPAWETVRPGTYTASVDATVAAYSGVGKVLVMRGDEVWRTFHITVSGDTPDAHIPLALDPPGRRLAIGSFHAHHVWVWQLDAPGEPALLHETAFAGSVAVAFSPDGRWLACCGGEETRVLDTATWQTAVRWPRRASDLYGQPAWTPDGTLLAVQHSREDITLHRAGTWQEILQLQAPTEDSLTAITLSRTGHWLAAIGYSAEIWLWHLPALRRELESRSLGWE